MSSNKPERPEPVGASSENAAEIEETPATEAASEAASEKSSESEGPAETAAPDALTEEIPIAVIMEANAATPDAPGDSEGAAAAALKTAAPEKSAPKKGARLNVKLVQIGDDTCFVDFGGRSEGAIATTELKDKEGNLLHKEGEEFSAVVKSSGDDVVFTLGKKSPPPGLKKIQEAFEAKIPVQGVVKSTNKGGFEVRIHGLRAFCPLSQIERGFCNEPERYVGQKLPFEIINLERNGRNIVLSRRKLLEAEAGEAATHTREKLGVGAVFAGIVQRIQPYGAFIDIGGLDGLVHVSQISHSHVKNPKDILKVGDKVDVKVLKIDDPGGPSERISLSIKAMQPDPWGDISTLLPVGTTTKGKVVRLAAFGAFVEIMPGVDGLVHISQISSERIEHPGDVLKVGDEVEAQILDIDGDKQRISLTLRTNAGAQDRPHSGDRGGDGRRPRSGRTPMRDAPSEYRSEPEVKKAPDVDVSGMEFDDALALLKQKLEGGN
jgi:small subunit ribosomal protein S1